MADLKKKVLIVDDEEDIREYLSSLLEDHGYEVTCAVDGDDALVKVKAHKPDLITLDISMPEKSGVKFYREMKESEELKAVPIIMVTGVAGEFKQFISSRKQVPPPEGYMAKPIDRDKIVAMVDTLTAS